MIVKNLVYKLENINVENVKAKKMSKFINFKERDKLIKKII